MIEFFAVALMLIMFILLAIAAGCSVIFLINILLDLRIRIKKIKAGHYDA